MADNPLKIKLPHETSQGLTALKDIMPHIETLLRIIKDTGVDIEELENEYNYYKNLVLKIGAEYGTD